MRRFTPAFLLAAACSGPPSAAEPPDGAPVVEPQPVHAIFEVPREGAPPPSGFYGLPFPNDVRVGDDGHIDLSDHVRPNPLIGLYVDTIADEQRGFSLSAAGFILFDGPIDPFSLPPSPDASRMPGASVYLVDVDPDSPEYGQAVPVRTNFARRAGESIAANALGILPYPGFILREQTTYALVATRRITNEGGEPVEVAPELSAIAAAEVPDDPALARAQAIYAPLWAWLDEPGGDERDDVVSAAVFTTQDATSLLGRIREVIYRDLPVPRPKQVRRRTASVGFAWYDGKFDSPNFLKGTVPYMLPEDGGEIEIDPESGDPILQSMEELRFSITVPLGNMPEAGWPVVLYAHGTGGDYHSFVYDGTGGRLAAVGIACISMDQVLHGPRNPGGNEEVSFFNLQNPFAVRNGTLQGALDDFQLLRLARNFDFIERRASGLRTKLDPDKTYFFGHSQGSTTGLPFVAHEPLIKGAVLSGAGALIYLALLEKTQPIDIAGIIKIFLRDEPLNEFNPFLAFLQLYLDRTDSAAYARLLLAEPLDGIPKNIFLTEGLIDRYTPVPDIEALAVAMRIDPVEPILQGIPGLALAGRTVKHPPMVGNWNGATAGLLQYKEKEGSDGHFVVFDVPSASFQSINFLSSLAYDGKAKIFAP